MSKISTYEVAPVPKLADKLIGTSVGGEIEDVTYNFTLQELLDVFLPVIPANNLQGVLDYGNTATQDINLFGTITTTNLDVTDTANFLDSYFVGETHIEGGLFDATGSIGTAGQVLTSTGTSVDWVTLPPIFTPNLQQVLTVGNTSTIGIVLTAGLEATDVDTNTATINTNITIDGTITDEDASVGTSGSVLSSTVTGVKWVPLPVYSATSPLLFNSATGVFSIQQATNAQNGYLSSSDWITFNGKQNAGNYISALTGEATASGPGSATVTLSNSAVIGKVLTGFNPTAGTINASDSILTAFGKTQSQINALVGGVAYQGTWNASANVPTLTSSVGVQGHYYVVNVAGNTNLNGITDWQVGDWAIFSESVWQKVDNTESVSSVNGFTGAVSLTTDNIPEGTTNLYFLNSRARQALSFLPGSGAYDNTSGAITIPTDNNQILNGAGYITFGSLSASSPLVYNNLIGAFSIPQATSLVDGYLSATDWSTFNGKQNYLGGTGLVKSTAGTISYITDNSSNWNTAYDRSIISAAVTGTTTKTLTLNEQDGSTITASWTDLDTGLTSVGVSMPGAFTVTNSPLTSNGTIAITGAGTNLQYIDGTGALQTFPGLTGFVPYTGATTNVDLGTYGLISDYLRLNTTPSSVPTTAGTMAWNDSDGTLDIRLKGGNVTLQVGEETVVRVVNKSGVDLLEANYQVVRVRNEAEGGAQGQRLAVVLARANTKVNHTGLLGIVTETIDSNQEGFVTNFGIVRDIDTTGDLQGETWVDGDVLWLSETTAGALTNVEPTTHPVQIGYVTYAHANNGKIFVYLQEGVDELDELHDVSIVDVANNQGLFYDSATSLWKNKSIATVLGYTPANAATTLTINGTTYDLSANRSWSVGTVTSVAALTLGTSGTDLSSSVATGTTTPVITLNVPTASAANRGALSAADWATFNTKVGSVTASSPLSSSGGSTPNITIQQSSGSQDGYLSSTDWTTFNNKQAAGNYITSLTGEATATGPGAAAVTLDNAAVTGKILTGVNITGGTILATDSILTGFGKLQNQVNGLIGGSIYQGTWNANTNTPTLTSSVGTAGYYYIVSVAGNTNLNGITDWQVGDWAIFNGGVWQKVDNTDSVISVNGQTGAVSLTTDNISEGTTNLYYLDSRARGALSFTAGSGAYNSTTGVITIPTNTSQLTNGANFITLASLNGTAPIQYNNTTGAISITQSGTASNGFLSSTDWNTFNNKQPAGNYVTLDTTQTITAAKTFSLDILVNSLTIGRGAGSIVSNTVVGAGALAANTTGTLNTAIGNLALQSITTGYGNTSVGYNALGYGTTGFFNAAVGVNALLFNSTGTYNNALGTAALYANTTGSYNTAVGQQAGTSNTTGSNNTYIGYSSGFDITTGSNNTIIGRYFGTAALANNIVLADGAGNVRYRYDGTNNNLYGNVNFSSTIGNGTFTYTFPNATGTLALTSNLSAYLPLTGGTLTGALSGTSATFSGNLNQNAPIFIDNSNHELASFSNNNLQLFFSSIYDGTNVIAKSGAGGRIVMNGGAFSFQTFGSATIGNAVTPIERFAISNGGAATFSSSVTAGGDITINKNNSTDAVLKVQQSTNFYASAINLVAANDGGAVYNYISSGTNGATPMWQIGGGASSNTMVMYTAGTERMRITASGNVGIGTSNPNRRLVVMGGNGNQLELDNTGQTYTQAFWKINGVETGTIWASTSEFHMYTYGSQSILFSTNNAERMRITSGGNVGIGTSSPANRLTISNNGNAAVAFRINDTNANASFLSLNASDSDAAIIAGGTSAIPFDIYTGGSQRMRITSGGNVGIGTSSPSAVLEVAGTSSTSDFRISRTVSSSTYFYIKAPGGSPSAATMGVNGTDVMVLNASGNVGIGTSSPSARLTVATSSGETIRMIGADTIGDNYMTFFNTAGTRLGYMGYGGSNTNTFEINQEANDPLVMYTAGTERMRITSDARVLIGKTTINIDAADGFRFDENGAMFASISSGNETYYVRDITNSVYRFYVTSGGTINATNTTISAISDVRLKENITDLEIGLDAIMALRPRKFDWKKESGNDGKNVRGFIAQEFEQVFPDLIDESLNKSPEGEAYKQIRQDLIPILVKAIQEQQAQIEELKAMIAAK